MENRFRGIYHREILHQLIDCFSHYLWGFFYPPDSDRWKGESVSQLPPVVATWRALSFWAAPHCWAWWRRGRRVNKHGPILTKSAKKTIKLWSWTKNFGSDHTNRSKWWKIIHRSRMLPPKIEMMFIKNKDEKHTPLPLCGRDITSKSAARLRFWCLNPSLEHYTCI